MEMGPFFKSLDEYSRKRGYKIYTSIFNMMGTCDSNTYILNVLIIYQYLFKIHAKVP